MFRSMTLAMKKVQSDVTLLFSELGDLSTKPTFRTVWTCASSQLLFLPTCFPILFLNKIRCRCNLCGDREFREYLYRYERYQNTIRWSARDISSYRKFDKWKILKLFPRTKIHSLFIERQGPSDGLFGKQSIYSIESFAKCISECASSRINTVCFRFSIYWNVYVFVRRWNRYVVFL